MIVSIKSNEVMFEGETGETIYISTDQLLELVRILDITFREDGTTVF